MPLLQTGRDHIAAKIIGTSLSGSTSDYDSSKAWIYVGSSTTAHAATQTWLLGTATGSTMEAGYPTISSGNVLTFRSLFSTSEANFDWNEWGVKNSSSSSTSTGALLNRMMEQLGTKANTQSWQLTATVTVTT